MAEQDPLWRVRLFSQRRGDMAPPSGWKECEGGTAGLQAMDLSLLHCLDHSGLQFFALDRFD